MADNKLEPLPMYYIAPKIIRIRAFHSSGAIVRKAEAILAQKAVCV